MGTNSEKGVTMTMEELISDYIQNTDDTTKTYSYQLESLDDGDMLIIKDTLKSVFYMETNHYTLIDFESAASPPIMIEGDITDNFGNGDTIELTLHILYVTFTQEIDGDTWTIELETFQEGWENDTKVSVPIPQEFLTLLEEGENNVITMTMEQLNNDYNLSIDNNTRRATLVYKSLDEGDTLIIRDTLNSMTYNASGEYTLIDFESSANSFTSIEGDITTVFKKGDRIELTLHVINIIYTRSNPYTGEIWTFEHEAFKEGWDSENATFIPIPQQYITLIN